MAIHQVSDEFIRVIRSGAPPDRVRDALVRAEDVVSVGGSGRGRLLGVDDLSGFVDGELSALDVVGEVALVERQLARMLRGWECWTRFAPFLGVASRNKARGQTGICLLTAFHLVTLCFIPVLDK